MNLSRTEYGYVDAKPLPLILQGSHVAFAAKSHGYMEVTSDAVSWDEKPDGTYLLQYHNMLSDEMLFSNFVIDCVVLRFFDNREDAEEFASIYNDLRGLPYLNLDLDWAKTCTLAELRSLHGRAQIIRGYALSSWNALEREVLETCKLLMSEEEFPVTVDPDKTVLFTDFIAESM